MTVAVEKTDYTFLQQTNPHKETGPTRASLVLHNCLMKCAVLICQFHESNFFTMAQDLLHHVRAMKAVASSKVPNLFVGNGFVRDYLASLKPHHRAIYHHRLL